MAFFQDFDQIDQWLRKHASVDSTGYTARKHSEQVVIGLDYKITVKDCEFALWSVRDRQLPVEFETAGGGFRIAASDITTLQGCPRSVKGTFFVQSHLLDDLTGGPRQVGDEYIIKNGFDLLSLQGLARDIGSGIVEFNLHPRMGVLSLFNSHNITTPIMNSITPGFTIAEMSRIVRRYISKGIAGMMPCAAELIKAGFRDNAKL